MASGVRVKSNKNPVLLVILGLAGIGSSVLTPPATAEEMLFLPNTLPLSADTIEHPFLVVRSLSNLGLEEQASLLRSGEMSAAQRALNHQWLSIHSGEEDDVDGGKALSRIAKYTLREYWRNKRQQLGDNRFIPDSDGRIATQINDVDYDVKLSDNGLKFGFTYEFE